MILHFTTSINKTVYLPEHVVLGRLTESGYAYIDRTYVEGAIKWNVEITEKEDGIQDFITTVEEVDLELVVEWGIGDEPKEDARMWLKEYSARFTWDFTINQHGQLFINDIDDIDIETKTIVFS